MASTKVGDIVFADRGWFLVTEKEGQRIKGRLLYRSQGGGGGIPTEYRFTSRAVERVFRELGRRTQKAQAEA